MSDNPPILTGKRKRTTISYAEFDNVDERESDIEGGEIKSIRASLAASHDSDDDMTFGSRRKRPAKKARQKTKTRAIPKAKADKPFRFLNLPPELRDMIYEMALTDVDGVGIVPRMRGYRRSAARGPVYEESSYDRPAYRRRSRRRLLKSGSQSAAPVTTKFVPALLAVNKQINAEGINYLYGQEFVFEETVALYQFLTIIGFRNQQRLVFVEILNWSTSGAASRHNYSALTALAGATSLQSLVLSCRILHWTGMGDKVARELYKVGHQFLEACMVTNGGKDAVLDILELNEDNFPHAYRSSGLSPVEDEQQLFEEELRKLLGAK